jgi:beta-N-acetylhexosaminidase
MRRRSRWCSEARDQRQLPAAARRPPARRHDIIGDRALGSEPMQVAALGRAVLDGLAAGGVVGVVKHMPGHGRSMVDSHKELPVVRASEEELESTSSRSARSRTRRWG